MSGSDEKMLAKYKAFSKTYDNLFYLFERTGGTAFFVDYGREEAFLSQWLFADYLRLSYPRRVREFLDYDWNQILTSTGFRMDSIESYRASRLICAKK